MRRRHAETGPFSDRILGIIQVSTFFIICRHVNNRPQYTCIEYNFMTFSTLSMFEKELFVTELVLINTSKFLAFFFFEDHHRYSICQYLSFMIFIRLLYFCISSNVQDPILRILIWDIFIHQYIIDIFRIVASILKYFLDYLTKCSDYYWSFVRFDLDSISIT